MNYKNSIAAFFILLLLPFSSCQPEEEIGDEQNYWESYQPFKTNYNSRDLAEAPFFAAQAEGMGDVDLPEVSGLAWSSNNPGYLWAHQDHGNDNLLYLLSSQNGAVVATYRIKGIENRDWEDIEIAPGPTEDLNYLYIGDIGDNEAVYGNYTIFRFEEPVFQETHRGKEIKIEPKTDKIRFHYPERNHDVETLLVDPHTKDIYVVTKRELNAILYVAPYPQKLEEEFTLLKAGEFSFTHATGGSISRDGSEILIKNYDQIFYWQRFDGEALTETLSRAPMEAPYKPREAQGEAICFDYQGGYYTLSERWNNLEPILYYYARD